MLSLLKVKDYGQLAVGQQQYFSSVILDLNMASSSWMVHGHDPGQVFSSVNQVLSRILPIVYGSEGIAESFENGGLCALFGDGRERALEAAISICEAIYSMETEAALEGVSMGLAFGSVMIGVVGHERRMTLLTLSQAKEFASFLRTVGTEYGSKITVPEGFLEEIEDLRAFNYRFLGYVYRKQEDRMERIYDVFDGDYVEARNRKRKTKRVFELGVKLFSQQQLLEARQHFIEVLKMDGGDLAAKKYLLLCDEALNGSRRTNVYIESYE